MASPSHSKRAEEPPLHVFAAGKPRRGRPPLPKSERDKRLKDRRQNRNPREKAYQKKKRNKSELFERAVANIGELLEQNLDHSVFRDEVNKIIMEAKRKSDELEHGFQEAHPPKHPRCAAKSSDHRTIDA